MGSKGCRGEGWGLQGRSWGNSALAIEECLPSPLQKRSTVSEKERKKKKKGKDFFGFLAAAGHHPPKCGGQVGEGVHM